jgi:hypothetical protein
MLMGRIHKDVRQIPPRGSPALLRGVWTAKRLPALPGRTRDGTATENFRLFLHIRQRRATLCIRVIVSLLRECGVRVLVYCTLAIIVSSHTTGAGR